MFRVIAFDWGNTLAHSERLKGKLNAGDRERLLRKAGFNVPRGFSQAFEAAAHEHQRVWGDHRRHDWRPVYEKAFARCGGSFSTRSWQAFLHVFLDYAGSQTRLFPGVKPMLARLAAKGYVLALVSNANEDVLRSELRGAGVERFFRHIIISQTERAEKSQLKPFQTLLRRLNQGRRKRISPSEVLMVGDRADEDAYAKRIGIRVVLLTNGLSHQPGVPEQPDYEIKDIRELPDLLERIENPN